MRDEAVHLPAGTQMHLGSLPDVGRTEYFKLWLAAIAVLSMSSYATGHCAAHGVFLLVAAILFILSVSSLVARTRKVSRARVHNSRNILPMRRAGVIEHHPRSVVYMFVRFFRFSKQLFFEHLTACCIMSAVALAIPHERDLEQQISL